MDSHDDTSYVTSTGDEYSDADNTVFYHPLGAKATSSKVIWETLSDMCKRSIGSKFRQSKDSISMDVDAFSFVISADTLNKDKKMRLGSFYYPLEVLLLDVVRFPRGLPVQIQKTVFLDVLAIRVNTCHIF